MARESYEVVITRALCGHTMTAKAVIDALRHAGYQIIPTAAEEGQTDGTGCDNGPGVGPAGTMDPTGPTP